MRKLPIFQTRPAAGFTLVELMVVVLIATILTVIAVPSYTNYVRKSRRVEAKSFLLDFASREERYMATNGQYSTTASDLGISAFPQKTATQYYQLETPTITAASASSTTTAATPATFQLTATAIGIQAKDTQCSQFIVDNTGAQTSKDSSGNVTTGCW